MEVGCSKRSGKFKKDARGGVTLGIWILQVSWVCERGEATSSRDIRCPMGI